MGITMDSSEQYTEYDKETGKVHKREVVTVGSITDGSVAQKHFKIGDIIESITIDGKIYEIDRMYQVIDCMFSVYENSTVTVSIKRDGVALAFSVPISEMTSQKVA